MSEAKPRPVTGKPGEAITISHRMDHIGNNIAHTRRHLEQVHQKGGGPDSDHALHHLGEVETQVAKLAPLLEKHVPGVKEENRRLDHMSEKIKGSRARGAK